MNPPSDVSVQIRALRLWHYYQMSSAMKEGARKSDMATSELDGNKAAQFLHEADWHGELASVHHKAARALDGLFPITDSALKDEFKFHFDGKNIPIPRQGVTFTDHLDKVQIPPLHLALNAGLDNVIEQLLAMKKVL